jgi:hypothetical protein
LGARSGVGSGSCSHRPPLPASLCHLSRSTHPHRLGCHWDRIRSPRCVHLGGAGQSVPPPTRHLRRQLGLSHLGVPTIYDPRQRPSNELRSSCRTLDGRELAQPSPLAPAFGTPRRGAGPNRLHGALDQIARVGWAHLRCSLAVVRNAQCSTSAVRTKNPHTSIRSAKWSPRGDIVAEQMVALIQYWTRPGRRDELSLARA